MLTVDIVFIGIIICAALLGYVLGFGRSLKLATKGIIGVIISLVICFMFGGTLKNIPAVSEFIQKIDTYFSDLWSFLGYLHLGTVVFYVCLFLLVQLARILIIRITLIITGMDSTGMKFVNKILGVVFMATFLFALTLLGLAVLKLFENSEIAVDILVKLEDGLLFKLYENNPIVF